MGWQIEQRNGLHLPEIDWHLDARRPVARSFVSHAHFDHMGNHQTILCSPPTAKLVQRRISGERNWDIHEFGEPFEIAPGVKACLYPAGHIIGSAMLWLEKDGQSFLYTGDFKLTPGISAEACQPVKADTLVIETTYGLPKYTFPPENEIYRDIIRFCRETLGNGDTPVLFGYSLGKSQAILKSLTNEGLEVMLHPAALKLTQSCQKLGWKFPAYHAFEDRNHADKVVIAPPLSQTADWMQRIRSPKTAMISGWAIDPSATYRYQCDKAFPLSDHADYLDLLNFVTKVAPKEVYTVHGFAQEFAATLRERGYQALALGSENQLDLDLNAPSPNPESALQKEPPAPAADNEFPANSFAALASRALALSKTDSIQQKLSLLDSQLSGLSPEDVETSIELLDTATQDTLNELAPKLVRQSLAFAVGASESEFKSLYQTSPDNRSAARTLLEKNPQAPSKSLADLKTFLKTLATAPNPIFKQSLLGEQFRKLSPGEGLFLYDYLCQTPQTGLSKALLCQAIANRYKQKIDRVQAAFLRSGNLLTVAKAAASDTLDQIKIFTFQPIAPVASKDETSPEAIIEQQGLALWAEPEHDGIRCQLHKDGDHVDLYSSSGERITHLFPELVDDARMIPQHFICDAVVVPWGYETPLPRAELEKRLHRKAEELFLGEDVSVVLWLFDILSFSGDDLLDLPLEQRRPMLETFSVTPKIRITPVQSLMGAEQIELALEKSRARGAIGLIFKDPQSPYNPLSKSPIWLRLPAKESD